MFPSRSSVPSCPLRERVYPTTVSCPPRSADRKSGRRGCSSGCSAGARNAGPRPPAVVPGVLLPALAVVPFPLLLEPGAVCELLVADDEPGLAVLDVPDVVDALEDEPPAGTMVAFESMNGSALAPPDTHPISVTVCPLVVPVAGRCVCDCDVAFACANAAVATASAIPLNTCVFMFLAPPVIRVIVTHTRTNRSPAVPRAGGRQQECDPNTRARRRTGVTCVWGNDADARMGAQICYDKQRQRPPHLERRMR